MLFQLLTPPFLVTKDYVHKQKEIKNLGLRKNFFYYCITTIEVTPLSGISKSSKKTTVLCTKSEGSRAYFMVCVCVL